MQFYNLALYDATQNSITSFSLTLVTTYEAIPDGAPEIIMGLRDTAGNAARVLGSLSSNTLTIIRIFSTTESDNSMPTFGAGLQAASSDVAEVLGTPFVIGGAIGSGQSNMMSINTGKTSLDPLFFDEEDHRIKQSTHNRLGARTYVEAYAVEPLFHQTISGATSLGPMIPFSYELLKEGYIELVIIPTAVSAAAISVYASGQPEYIKMKDAVIAWLNESPNNKLIVWAQMQGETDAGLTTTHDDYRDANIAMRDDLAVDVLSATGVDIGQLPFLAIGLGPDFIAGQGSSAQSLLIRDAIEDIPNFMPYSAHVDVPAGVSRNASSNEGGSTDETHLSAEGQFLIARELFMPALAMARKNFSPIGLGTILNATAPNVPVTGNTGDIFTNEPTVLNATAPNVPVVGNTGDITTTETGLTLEATAPNVPVTGSTADFVIPLDITDTLATSPTGYYRSDSGVQLSGSDVTQLDDLSGNANHFLPGDGTVTLVSEELDFDGASDLTRAAMFTFSPRDGTIIVELRGSAGTPFQEVAGAGGTRMFTNDIYQMKPGVGTNLESITSPDIRDGVTRVAAMTLDGTDFKVFNGTAGAGVTETHSETSAAPSFFVGGNGWIGSDGSASSYWTGVIRRYYVKDGDALTLTEINDVVAEF